MVMSPKRNVSAGTEIGLFIGESAFAAECSATIGFSEVAAFFAKRIS